MTSGKMMQYIFLVLIAVIGVKGNCILNEESRIDGSTCSAVFTCDVTTELLLNTIKSSFNCIKRKNDNYYYYANQPEFIYDNNYVLSIFVNDVDINISEDPLTDLLDVHNTVISLKMDRGNLVSMPGEVSRLSQLREFSLTNNYIVSVNLNDFVLLANMQTINMSYNLISSIETTADINDRTSTITAIDLSHNVVESIPDNCFVRFSRLKYLDLSFNRLTNFDILTFEGMTQIEKLFLSNNRIIEIGHNFARFVKLEYLSLDHNRLKTITDLNFKMLSKLEKLDLSFNFINNIENNSFSALTNLGQLDLSHNNIKVIKKTLFKNNIMMHKLFLSHNDIENIEAGAFNTNNISVFDIRDNSLCVQIESDTFQGIHVQNLDISGGNLKGLGDRAFSAFSSDLNYLNLSSNRIANVSQSAFKSLKELLILDFSSNELVDIDFDIHDLKKLSEYYLQNNKIKKITSNMFKSLTSLIKLDISQNDIEEIELNSFTGIPNLNILNISNNFLSSELPVGLFSVLYKVETLDLSYTRVMYHRNKTFAGMVSLITLNSSHSQLEQIEYEAYKETGNLQIIDLSYNILEYFHVNTSNIMSLSELYLNHNKIKKVMGDTFKNLKLLKKLNLASNNILYIDSSGLQSLTHLTYLNLSSNVNLKFSNQTFNNLSLSQVSLTNIMVRFDFENTINTSISTLYIKYCNIENINSVSVYKIKNIMKLDISSNKIKYLDRGSFQSMNILNWLDLSLNMISDIKPGTFRLTNMINTLNISSNNLQYLPFGVLDGLTNLRLLNLSSNAIHTFGANLLHNTPALSYLSLENNNIANIDFIQFSKTNIQLLYIGGNIISCDVLLGLNKMDLEHLIVTTASNDFNVENVNGISCRTNLLQESAVGKKNNEDNAVSVQATVERFYNNLTTTLNEILSRMDTNWDKNLLTYLDNITEVLHTNPVSTNQVLSDLSNDIKKLHSSVINENKNLLTNLQSIISSLLINNNLTKYGNNYTQELNKAIIKGIRSRVEETTPTGVVLEKYKIGIHNENLSVQYTLADIEMMLSKNVWLLYCVVTGLAIIIIFCVIVLYYNYCNRLSIRRLRNSASHNSGQSMPIEME